MPVNQRATGSTDDCTTELPVTSVGFVKPRVPSGITDSFKTCFSTTDTATTASPASRTYAVTSTFTGWPALTSPEATATTWCTPLILNTIGVLSGTVAHNASPAL